MRGPHIIIEGIDGSGKSTVIQACQTWAEARGSKMFDVVKFSKEAHRLPTLLDLGDSTGLLTAEPTFTWVGAAIREEMIAKHEPGTDERVYSGFETAEAYAVDRLIQFRRLIIPFLSNHPERIVIQDRSLASSLAYQPTQDPTLTTDLLTALPGNAQTLAFPPTMLILIRTEAAVAMARLAGRADKKDEHIFEETSFQERLVARFLSEDVLGPFRNAGTVIVEIDGNATKEQVAADVTAALKKNLDSANLKTI